MGAEAMNRTDNLAMHPGAPKVAEDFYVAFSCNDLRQHVTAKYLSDTFAPGEER